MSGVRISPGAFKNYEIFFLYFSKKNSLYYGYYLSNSMNILKNLKESDPVISNFINSEKNRQETHLELIASENFASIAVMQAQGSVLTNKYAEGLPQKRYYGGCEFVDEIEELAIQRAKKLFNANWANVQPHSGAQACAPL